MQDRLRRNSDSAHERQVVVRPQGPNPFALQRLAGNRATAALLTGLLVQRVCGPDCACPGCRADPSPPEPRLKVQRTASSGVFNTTLTPVDQNVAVTGTNAADWNNNAHAKIGGEGGKEEVSGGQVDTSLTQAGLVDGADVTWTITKTVPTVDESAFTNDAEKAAAKALADRLAQHEESHKQNDLTGRKDFTKTLKGKKDSDVDAASNALECRVGRTQRALDNSEGVITLDSSNQIKVSGKDHPEYEGTCNP